MTSAETERPPESSALRDVLAILRNNPKMARNITAWRVLPAQEARTAPFPETLAPPLRSALEARGVQSLYTHQAQAFEAAEAGRNFVVVTPTASGKSLCYVLPVVQSILKVPASRALLLFPTKALSQDQCNEIYSITHGLEQGIKIYTFDGDTPAAARRAIRSAGHIVVTNPDMLHAGILPHHTRWIKLFENLKYVVIDEVHHYRGVFGSHVANVLRRLRRICRFYGSNPTFIACSATIANPKELAENLVEAPFELIDDNGAPRGEKAVIFYNPPVVNEELGIRRSVVNEAKRLAVRFLERNLQTIVFARSRMRVEILATYLRRAMIRLKRDPNSIRGYRGGYLPNERRAIEQGVKSGEILGVVSTNALELGIDIGQLKVCVIAGYPGTVSSAWQQGGRAGRKGEPAAIVLVGSSGPLDQFIVTHPEYFFGASPESGIVNPDNIAILASHLKCAAFEIPFEDGERFGRAEARAILDFLAEADILRHTGGRYHWASEVYPAEEISLRSASADNFVVLDVKRGNQALAEIDYESAPFLIHEEAIYIHQSQPYFIDRLDWDRRTAYAREIKTDFYTDAQAKTDVHVLHQNERHDFAAGARARGPARPSPVLYKSFGEVTVRTIVAKYKKVRFETHENVGWGEVKLPEQELQTEAYWIAFRPELKEEFEARDLDLGSGLQGVATVMGGIVPLFVLCDRGDFCALAMMRSLFDELPSVYLYDRYPGGIGLARKVYNMDTRILRAALERQKECRCGHGCPSCVGPPLETGSDKAKRSAARLLELILGE
ncbi:MAG: ATP-dependent RNA helicase DbpA [candidate division BRC1 bacterium ADurb.BinA364]|nr:MAG: ATP-dependent RNA helicase DbpA [candidate division BRC1 bacterium ADurb.BinA364]